MASGNELCSSCKPAFVRWWTSRQITNAHKVLYLNCRYIVCEHAWKEWNYTTHDEMTFSLQLYWLMESCFATFNAKVFRKQKALHLKNTQLRSILCQATQRQPITSFRFGTDLERKGRSLPPNDAVSKRDASSEFDLVHQSRLVIILI